MPRESGDLEDVLTVRPVADRDGKIGRVGRLLDLDVTAAARGAGHGRAVQ